MNNERTQRILEKLGAPSWIRRDTRRIERESGTGKPLRTSGYRQITPGSFREAKQEYAALSAAEKKLSAPEAGSSFVNKRGAGRRFTWGGIAQGAPYTVPESARIGKFLRGREMSLRIARAQEGVAQGGAKGALAKAKVKLLKVQARGEGKVQSKIDAGLKRLDISQGPWPDKRLQGGLFLTRRPLRKRDLAKKLLRKAKNKVVRKLVMRGKG